MRFGAFLAFSVCLTLGLFLTGNQSIYNQMVGYNTNNATNINTAAVGADNQTANLYSSNAVPGGCGVADFICLAGHNTTVLGLVVASIAGVTLFAGLLSGFGVIYIIPMILLLIALALFVMPFGFIFNDAYPIWVTVPLVSFFNLMFILAIISLIRGGV